MYRASLLVVGTEIAEGIIQDTHTQYLAAVVRRLGFTLVSSTVVPDDEDLIAGRLRQLVEESNLVLITGGLGPTSDDKTRDVVAGVAGRDLAFHEDIWERLRSQWRRWHGTDEEPAASNRRQAFIPDGFQVLTNDVGTAPGFIGIIEATRVAALPGPPRELRRMVEGHLLPILEEGYDRTEEQELRGTAFLVGESSLEDALQAVAGENGGDVRWGTRAEPYRIDFYLRGGNGGERQAIFDALRVKLGAFRVRSGVLDPAAHLLGVLTEKGMTGVTAESCTGGLIASLLTEIPGSSTAFWGGVVSYANEAKTRVLGVSESVISEHGAVSYQAVEQMLHGARRLSGADLSIAVSGIAGPSGGTPQKPVGTVWIGALTREGTQLIRQFRFVGGRARVRRKSAVVGLLMAADVSEGRVEEIDVDLDTYEIS